MWKLKTMKHYVENQRNYKMQVLIKDVTGVPPYHLYKKSRVLLFEIECNCGKKTRKIFILEDTKGKK